MDVLTISWGWIGGKMPGTAAGGGLVMATSRPPDFDVIIWREKLLKEDEELIIID